MLYPFPLHSKNNRGLGRTVHGNTFDGLDGGLDDGYPPVQVVERQICERPTDSANVAIVSQLTFGPALFRFTSSSNPVNVPMGSLLVATKGGIVKAYAMLADKSWTTGGGPSKVRLQLAKQLILQHRAPILDLRLLDSRHFILSSTSSESAQHVSALSCSLPYTYIVASLADTS